MINAVDAMIPSLSDIFDALPEAVIWTRTRGGGGFRDLLLQ